MSYVVSLTGYTPVARYDGLPWTQARMGEAATSAGPFTTIQTFTLSPTDADPTKPATRSFTSNAATLSSGFYLITFVDAGGNLEPTTPVAYPAAGSTSDLTSLATVRAFLQKPASDTNQDALISSLISRASAAFHKYSGREFAPASSGLTRTFEFPWEGEFVSLAPYELRAVTSITIDSDQSPGLVLSTQEWRLWPQPPADGTYLAVRIRPFSAVTGRVLWRNRQVQITGDWGMLSVPGDVEQACLFTVKEWLEAVNQRNAGLQADDSAMDSMSGYLASIPYNARLTLDRYKRAVNA